MDAILDAVPGVLQTLFGVTANRLAQQTGFVRRVRQVTPSAWARSLSLLLVREPGASLTQLGQKLAVTGSAVSQRLNDLAASAFLLALLHAALSELAATSAKPVDIPLLRRFNGVYLVDGTTLSLPPTLAERFAGYCGGTYPGDPYDPAIGRAIFRRYFGPDEVDLDERFADIRDGSTALELVRFTPDTVVIRDQSYRPTRWAMVRS